MTEAAAFRLRLLEEFVTKLTQGLHAHGCEGYAGQYGMCNCLNELVTGAKNGTLDFQDFETRRDLPGIEDGLSIITNLTHVTKQICGNCSRQVQWGPYLRFDGQAQPVQCACGRWFWLKDGFAIVTWGRDRPVGAPPAAEESAAADWVRTVEDAPTPNEKPAPRKRPAKPRSAFPAL